MAQHMFTSVLHMFIYDYVLIQSTRQVQRRFEARFRGVKVPAHKTIHALCGKFLRLLSLEYSKLKNAYTKQTHTS